MSKRDLLVFAGEPDEAVVEADVLQAVGPRSTARVDHEDLSQRQLIDSSENVCIFTLGFPITAANVETISS